MPKESAPEFHRRLQDRLDKDSWMGISTVGAEFPQREVNITVEDEEAPPIYRNGRVRYGDGH